MLKIFFIILFNGFCIKCKDPDGIDVDWFISFKSPDNVLKTNDFFKNGTAYAYLDSSSTNFIYRSADITTSGPVVNTLSPLYDVENDVELVFMFNDEKPNGSTSTTTGHAKGVLTFNDTAGYWLMHSVPKFPPTPSDGYSYASNGYTYGQSFICVTIEDLYTMNIIGKHQKNVQPYIYFNKTSERLVDLLPDLTAAMGGTHNNNNANLTSTFTTTGGTDFSVFSKTGASQLNLLADYIILETKTSFAAETWMRPIEPPTCSITTHHLSSINILNMTVPVDSSTTPTLTPTSTATPLSSSASASASFASTGFGLSSSSTPTSLSKQSPTPSSTSVSFPSSLPAPFFQDPAPAQAQWGYTKDHSKFAVAMANNGVGLLNLDLVNTTVTPWT